MEKSEIFDYEQETECEISKGIDFIHLNSLN